MIDSPSFCKLKNWFSETKRSYPWRDNPTPYRVWISEVMLQQTQVERVVDYFVRWMRHLPTIQSVAECDEAALIKLWEGLGYYSRVRNIQKAAQYIVAHYGGALPAEYEALRALPGFGPYTASAVCCFGFNKRAFPLDANVYRVLSRLHNYQERVDTAKGRAAMHSYAEQWIPHTRPREIAEALIELGQRVCVKKPNCPICPLRKVCAGKKYALELPRKKAPRQRAFLSRDVALVLCGSYVWLFRESERKVMQGLWQFPYCEAARDPVAHFSGLCKTDLHVQRELPRVKHGFTHYSVTLIPHLFTVESLFPAPFGEWQPIARLEEMAFCSGHRELRDIVLDFHCNAV